MSSYRAYDHARELAAADPAELKAAMRQATDLGDDQAANVLRAVNYVRAVGVMERAESAITTSEHEASRKMSLQQVISRARKIARIPQGSYQVTLPGQSGKAARPGRRQQVSVNDGINAILGVRPKKKARAGARARNKRRR